MGGLWSLNVSPELAFVVGIFPAGIRVRLGVNAGNAEGSVSPKAADDDIENKCV